MAVKHDLIATSVVGDSLSLDNLAVPLFSLRPLIGNLLTALRF